MTPLWISVQGSAFRESLRLALQPTARRNCAHETYVHHDHKKHELSIFDRSFVFKVSETAFLTFSFFNPLFSSPFCNAFDIIWSCATAPSD